MLRNCRKGRQPALSAYIATLEKWAGKSLQTPSGLMHVDEIFGGRLQSRIDALKIYKASMKRGDDSLLPEPLWWSEDDIEFVGSLLMNDGETLVVVLLTDPGEVKVVRVFNLPSLPVKNPKMILHSTTKSGAQHFEFATPRPGCVDAVVQALQQAAAPSESVQVCDPDRKTSIAEC